MPITWKNVTSDLDISGISNALAQAGKSINTGLGSFEDVVRQQQQLNAANHQTLINNSTQDFLNKISAFSPEQLQTAMQDGSINQLRQGYDVRLDPSKTSGAALQSLLQTKYGQAKSANEYADYNAAREAVPLQNDITELMNTGQVNKAMALIGQLPEPLQKAELAKVDSYRDNNLRNLYGKAIANKDFASARTYADMYAERGEDASPMYGEIRTGVQGVERNNLLSSFKNLGNKYQQSLRDTQTSILEQAKKEGFTVKNGAIDYNSVKDPTKVKAIQDFISQTSVPTMTQFEQELIPQYQKYVDTYGVDGNLDSQIALLKQGITEPGKLGQFDNDYISKQFEGRRQAEKENGNPYYSDDKVLESSQDSIYQMLSDVAKDNPAFSEENLSPSDKAKLVEQLSLIATDGIKIGDEVITDIPQTVIKAYLSSGKGSGWFGPNLRDRLTDFAKKSNLGKHLAEKRAIDREENKLRLEMQKRNGYVSPDNIIGLKAGAEERLKVLQDEQQLKNPPQATSESSTTFEDTLKAKLKEAQTKVDNFRGSRGSIALNQNKPEFKEAQAALELLEKVAADEEKAKRFRNSRSNATSLY